MKNKLPILLILSGLALTALPVSADQVIYGSGGDLQLFVCDVLSSIGLGCGAPHPVADVEPQRVERERLSQEEQRENQRSATNNLGTGMLQASIANVVVRRTASDDEVILVKIPAANDIKATLGLNARDAIFEIIRGQKHFIPTVDIFFDYGFDLSVVQSVTYEDLKPFPRTKLVNVYNDSKKKYYITEGNMIRLVPNKNVFESYGDREEDIITISKKEFSYYPRNQFVFLENPLNRDVYQLTDKGAAKRYLTATAVKRMKIRSEQIAPINQTELANYQTDKPVVL